jgi:hypothetical protein
LIITAKSRSLRSSLSAVIYPVVKVHRPGGRLMREISISRIQRSAGRWAPSGAHGSGDGPRHDAAAHRTSLRAAVGKREIWTRGCLGAQPELWCLSSFLVQEEIPPLSRRGGGDEETRTPDPLLAKEMLFQLSYVPGVQGGWWWAFLDSNQRPLPYQGSALTS